MNICIVGGDLNPPFVEAQKNLAIELSIQLSMKGHTVHIVTESSRKLPCEEKWEKICFHRYRRQLFHLIAAHKIKKLNRKYDFDIIQNQNLTIHKSNILMSMLIKKIHIPIVSYICLQPSLLLSHWLYALKNDVKEALMRIKEFTPKVLNEINLSSVEKIVTSSNFLKETLIDKFLVQKNRVEVIPPFINAKKLTFEKTNVKKVRAKLCAADATPLLLFIGTHYVFRGEKDFLKAFSVVLQRTPNAKAILVTPFPIPRRIRNFIKNSGIKKSLIFLPGYVDIPSLISASNVYVFSGLSSVGGGSIDPPLTVVEAMAVGTPCVAYDTGGIQELTDNKKIHLVEPHNIYELANAITNVLKRIDTFNYREPGTLVGSRFDSEVAAGRFTSIYEKIIDGRYSC